MDGAPSVEWAGAILTNGDGDLLLNLRDRSKALFPNAWDLIGGTLEVGETPEACLLREVREETGEVLTAVRYLESFDVPLTGGTFGRLHLFLGELDRPASELLLGEGQEHRFFALQSLDDIEIVPGTREVLAAFASGRYNMTDFLSFPSAGPHPDPLPEGEGTTYPAGFDSSRATPSKIDSPSPRGERGPGGEVPLAHARP